MVLILGLVQVRSPVLALVLVLLLLLLLAFDLLLIGIDDDDNDEGDEKAVRCSAREVLNLSVMAHPR